MTNYYDFKKAQEIIDREVAKGTLLYADLGMNEDWSPTAESIWCADKGYRMNLLETTEIGGIDGSHWATPVLKFKHSTDDYECTIDVSKQRKL